MPKPVLPESPWLSEVRTGIGARPDIMCWRQHAGLFIPYPGTKGLPPTRVAPDGVADIIGLQCRRVTRPNLRLVETINPLSFTPHEREVEHFYGAFFAIETKSSIGTQEISQRRFEAVVCAMHGDYILAPAAEWAPIHAVLGREPDPVCAEAAQAMFKELSAAVDAFEAAQKARAGKRKRRA